MILNSCRRTALCLGLPRQIYFNIVTLVITALAGWLALRRSAILAVLKIDDPSQLADRLIFWRMHALRHNPYQ